MGFWAGAAQTQPSLESQRSVGDFRGSDVPSPIGERRPGCWLAETMGAAAAVYRCHGQDGAL
eukprot:5785087-Lingulodinium_polyedra.AAC.1